MPLDPAYPPNHLTHLSERFIKLNSIIDITENNVMLCYNNVMLMLYYIIILLSLLNDLVNLIETGAACLEMFLK